MSAKLEAVIELNNKSFIKGIDEMSKKAEDFTSKTSSSIDKMVDDMVDFNKETEEGADDTETFSQKAQNAFSKLEKSMLAVSVVSGGLFAKMISESPALSSAFAEMGFMFDEMFMVLGEALAPVIEQFVVPAVEKLTSFIIGLETPIQFAIASFIGLMTILTPVVKVFKPLVKLLGKFLKPAYKIVKVVINIARFLGVLVGGVSAVTLAIALFVAGLIAFFIAYKYNIGGVQDKTDAFVEKMVEFFKSLPEKIGKFISQIPEKLKKAFEKAKEVFVDFVDAVKDFFVEKFKIIIETDLGKTIVNGLIGVINTIIDAIDTPFRLLRNSTTFENLLPDVHAGIPDLSQYKIDTFHQGGVVGGNLGQERLVKVMAGEVIYNPMKGQTPATFMGGGSSKPPVVVNINNTFTNPNFTNELGMRQSIGQIDNTLRKNVHQYIGGR